MQISKQKKIIIFIILLALAAAMYYAQHSSYLSFACFNENKNLLLMHVQNKPIQSIFVYIFLYITVTLLTPSAALFALAGGFLFGVFKATLFIMIAATVSGSIAFMATRHLLGNQIQKMYEPQLRKFNEELKRYGSYYFLMVRIVPVFPFFLINILAGLTQVPFSTFSWTTAIGIIPGTMIYAFAGKQLGEISSVHGILSPSLFAALLFLGVLALIPVLFNKRRNN